MAERARLTTVFDVVLAPLLMLIVGLLGAEVSVTTKVMPSEAETETFPAVSLNQTYTVREWLPVVEALDSVKLTVAELPLLMVTLFQPESFKAGLELDSEA